MLETQFKNGNANLTCGEGCSGRYGWFKADLQTDYQNQDWTDLADRVMEIGFSDDESWFYLGRAAEGLGYYRAAKKYYEEASTYAMQKCGSVCDGIDVPSEVETHFDSVAAILNPPPPLPPRPPPKPTPDPPNTKFVTDCIFWNVKRLLLENNVVAFSTLYFSMDENLAVGMLKLGLTPEMACDRGVAYVDSVINQYGWLGPNGPNP